ncbi:MAG: folate-binding protein YgfZ [Chthoniobacterales bacterium]
MTASRRPADGALFDLSRRAKLRVGGRDRLRFLNGQLTNDARKASESEALEACILNAKGKMDAHLFLTAEPDSFLLDADSELRGSLPQRLERYIIADDVEVKDVTDELSILHIFDPERPSLGREYRLTSANRFGGPGWDVWVAGDHREGMVAELFEQFGFCGPDCSEIFRLEQGIPHWGRELTPEIIPIEANLEGRCIDYDKGCYIGQETISRMKMSGQTNKRLCGLVAAAGAPLAQGVRLYGGAECAKEVGWITSAGDNARLGKTIALGYVKRGFNSPGTSLAATAAADAPNPVSVQIVDLPFR